MAKVREHLSEYLDNWMTENKVSNNKIAEALGVSDVSVRRWRLGECAPDLDLIPELCDYMNVSINELLGVDNKDISVEQIEFLRKYNTDESFRNLMDSIRDDDELRLSLNYILTLKNKNK